MENLSRGNVNVADEDGKTLLHHAVLNDDMDRCRLLIQAGASLDERDHDDQTPLDLAIWNGDSKTTILLITAGASVTCKNQSNVTVLQLAATYLFQQRDQIKANYSSIIGFNPKSFMNAKEQERMIQAERDMQDLEAFLETFRVLLLSGADQDAFWEPNSHQTLLSKAAQEGYLDMCKLLLLAGADPNILDGMKNTALHMAVNSRNEEICQLLLISGSVIAENQTGRTPLHFAAHRNYANICQLLVQHEANVNAEDESGHSPIQIAVTGGHVDATNVLLESYQVDMGHIYMDGHTLLHMASKGGYVDICKLIIDYLFDAGTPEKINEPDKDLRTPLHLAAMKNHAETCQLLLTSDAYIKCADNDKDNMTPLPNAATPLHLAAMKNHAETCQLLLTSDAYIKCADKDNMTPLPNAATPLHLAAMKNHAETCQLLLKSDAYIKCADKDNMTPLHHAAKEHNAAVVVTLLSKAKEMYASFNKELLKFVNATDNEGNTALHYAMRKAQYEVYSPLLKIADVLILNKHGMSPFHVAIQNAKSDAVVTLCQLLLGDRIKPNDHKDSQGNSPLHIAAKRDKKEVCELLVTNYKTDIKAKNKNGYVALHYAAMLRRPAVCVFLLDVCEEVINTKGKEGKTPLHMAAQRGSDKICKLLLERGSQVNIEDQNGDTSLHYAAMRGDDKVCALLIKKGADALAANKNGDIPDDLWPEETRASAKTLRRERRKQANVELLATGERPVETVKLFLIGHPEAGKTTLKNSMDQEKYMVKTDDDDNDMVNSSANTRSSYKPTPGIAVERKQARQAGQFSVWDCAGQMEYHVTHGMFLGAQNSIFLVVYDLCRLVVEPGENRARPRQIDEIYYWLAFVKAVNANLDGQKPKIALVATHLDILPPKFHDLAEKNVAEVRDKFGDFLDISDQVFALGEFTNMDDFRVKLDTLAKSIRETRKIKGLCYKIEHEKDQWTAGVPPLLPYTDYCNRVKQITSVADVTERLIRAATLDLHDMGVIYWARLRTVGLDDFIVLDPNWLFSTIVGRLFAGENMPSSQPKLQKKPLYAAHEISALLDVEHLDVKLLLTFMEHLELVVPLGKELYLIPAKLPPQMESQAWNENPDLPCSEIYGRRIQCRDSIQDIFTPTAFPSLQARFIKKYKKYVIPVQDRLKFSDNGMSVFVQMTAKDKSGIDVITRCSGTEERSLCYEKLNEALLMITTELEEHCPGTATTTTYLSSACLQKWSPLSTSYVQVRSFSEEELLDAENQHGGKIYHDSYAMGSYDKVDGIICTGYDPFFIRLLGLLCHSKWLLISTMMSMDSCLNCDEAQANGTCYRFLASAMGITQLSHLENECTRTRDKITTALIREWCSKSKTSRTLGNLRAIIGHFGLVGNVDAIKPFDEMLESHNVQLPYDDAPLSDVPCIEPGVLKSREVFRRYWSQIRQISTSDELCDLLKGSLTSKDEEELQYLREIGGPRKVADRIAPILLLKSKDDWFLPLLKAMRLGGERIKTVGMEMESE